MQRKSPGGSTRRASRVTSTPCSRRSVRQPYVNHVVAVIDVLRRQSSSQLIREAEAVGDDASLIFARHTSATCPACGLYTVVSLSLDRRTVRCFRVHFMIILVSVGRLSCFQCCSGTCRQDKLASVDSDRSDEAVGVSGGGGHAPSQENRLAFLLPVLHIRLYWSYIIRSTPPSRPNIVGLKCPSARPYVRPSLHKKFLRF